MVLVAAIKANINVNIDANIKELATEILDTLGIDQAIAIDMFYRAIIKEKTLPFDHQLPELTQRQRILLNASKNGLPVVKLEFDENNELSNFDSLTEGVQDWIAND